MTGRPVSSRGLGLGVIALSVYATACASSGATPRPFPMPGAPTARRAPATAPAAPDDPAAAPAAPATPSPTPTAPAPAAPRGSRTAFDGYALAGTALALRGIPYRNGGSDPAGFDCSGFTQYVFAQHGVALPREVREQFHVGKSVRPDDLVAGDIVFFTTTDPGPSHVAIAIGGDEFVHAPSSAGVVRVEHLSSSYWAPRFIGARRVN
ncbi:MAG TPA: C40 family peptidase [Vicinamibacterales bacterium]|nr:C40 family peptidase [Vicinamibacterales bacterium]